MSDSPLGEFYLGGILCLISGVMMCFMSASNAALGTAQGSSPFFAAFYSFFSGSFVCFIFLLIWIKGDFNSIDSSQFSDYPPWVWIGGLMGGVMTLCFTTILPKTTVAVMLSVFVLSQVIFGMIMDNFSLLGSPYREFTVWRGLGVIGLFAGITLICRY